MSGPHVAERRGARTAAIGTIVVGFVVALEVVIMISPFALFFCSVFNPFLLALARGPATRWLTAFFLPHMVVPPNAVPAKALGVLLVLLAILVGGGFGLRAYTVRHLPLVSVDGVDAIAMGLIPDVLHDPAVVPGYPRPRRAGIACSPTSSRSTTRCRG